MTDTQIRTIKDKDTFEVKLDTKGHSIDARILANILSGFDELIKISAELIDKNIEAKLIVDKTEEGSWKAYFTVAVISLGLGCALPDNSKILKTLRKSTIAIDFTIAMFDLIKHIGGKKYKCNKYGDEVEVINHEGKKKRFSIELFNFHLLDVKIKNSKKISETSIKIFSSIEKSEAKSISINHNDKKHVYGKDSYESMQSPIKEDDEGDGDLETETEMKDDVLVTVLMDTKDNYLDLGFVFEGKTIKAKINPQEEENKKFLREIHSGEISIKSGDEINCLLIEEYKINKKGKRIHKKYTIAKINKYIPAERKEPTELENTEFFDESELEVRDKK